MYSFCPFCCLPHFSVGHFKPVTTLKDVDISCQTLNPNGAFFFFFFKVTILADQCPPKGISLQRLDQKEEERMGAKPRSIQ